MVKNLDYLREPNWDQKNNRSDPLTVRHSDIWNLDWKMAQHSVKNLGYLRETNWDQRNSRSDPRTVKN